MQSVNACKILTVNTPYSAMSMAALLVPNRSNKRAPKKGKRPSNGGNAGQAAGRLVPWNQDPMTDAMHLSGITMNIVRLRKNVDFVAFLSQSSSTFISNVYNFFLGQITDVTQLAAVFDQYRVRGLECVLRPAASQGLSATVLPSGLLYTVIDYDDGTSLTPGSAYTAYDNCITTNTYSAQRRCFKPRVAKAVYSGSAFTSFSNEVAPWIDSVSTGVPHYGLKAGIEPGNSTQLQVYSLQVSVELEFRQSR
jgi:hypothetical protein